MNMNKRFVGRVDRVVVRSEARIIKVYRSKDIKYLSPQF